MGVTFFGDVAPEEFGKFDRACITLFRVTSGGAWIDPIAFDSAGGINLKGAIFLVTYIFVVNWTLLQVSIAVLLDRFISSSVEMQSEKRALKEAEYIAKRQGRTALDPLLRILVKTAVHDADLSTRIQSLFKVIDFTHFSTLSSERHTRQRVATARDTRFGTVQGTLASPFYTLCSTQVLDSDDIGRLSCTEFCNAIKKMVLGPIR
jgi:hypothetical protein